MLVKSVYWSQCNNTRGTRNFSSAVSCVSAFGQHRKFPPHTRTFLLVPRVQWRSRPSIRNIASSYILANCIISNYYPMDQSLGTKAHDNIIMPCEMGNTVSKNLHFFVKSKEFDSTNRGKVPLKSFHLYEWQHHRSLVNDSKVRETNSL